MGSLGDSWRSKDADLATENDIYNRQQPHQSQILPWPLLRSEHRSSRRNSEAQSVPEERFKEVEQRVWPNGVPPTSPRRTHSYGSVQSSNTTASMDAPSATTSTWTCLNTGKSLQLKRNWDIPPPSKRRRLSGGNRAPPKYKEKSSQRSQWHGSNGDEKSIDHYSLPKHKVGKVPFSPGKRYLEDGRSHERGDHYSPHHYFEMTDSRMPRGGEDPWMSRERNQEWLPALANFGLRRDLAPGVQAPDRLRLGANRHVREAPSPEGWQEDFQDASEGSHARSKVRDAVERSSNKVSSADYGGTLELPKFCTICPSSSLPFEARSEASPGKALEINETCSIPDLCPPESSDSNRELQETLELSSLNKQDDSGSASKLSRDNSNNALRPKDNDDGELIKSTATRCTSMDTVNKTTHSAAIPQPALNPAVTRQPTRNQRNGAVQHYAHKSAALESELREVIALPISTDTSVATEGTPTRIVPSLGFSQPQNCAMNGNVKMKGKWQIENPVAHGSPDASDQQEHGSVSSKPRKDARPDRGLSDRRRERFAERNDQDKDSYNLSRCLDCAKVVAWKSRCTDCERKRQERLEVQKAKFIPETPEAAARKPTETESLETPQLSAATSPIPSISPSNPTFAPANKRRKKQVTHLDAQPGEYYFACIRTHPPWPSVVCDEDMLPSILVNTRPVTTKQIDGAYREPYADGGKRVFERTFPIMFLHTNEFAWIPNTDLTPLDVEDVTNFSEKNQTKSLVQAYRVAAEQNDLYHFKTMLADHDQAILEYEGAREARALKKAASFRKVAMSTVSTHFDQQPKDLLPQKRRQEDIVLETPAEDRGRMDKTLGDSSRSTNESSSPASTNGPDLADATPSNDTVQEKLSLLRTTISELRSAQKKDTLDLERLTSRTLYLQLALDEATKRAPCELEKAKEQIEELKAKLHRRGLDLCSEPSGSGQALDIDPSTYDLEKGASIPPYDPTSRRPMVSLDLYEIAPELRLDSVFFDREATIRDIEARPSRKATFGKRIPKATNEIEELLSRELERREAKPLDGHWLRPKNLHDQDDEERDVEMGGEKYVKEQMPFEEFIAGLTNPAPARAGTSVAEEASTEKPRGRPPKAKSGLQTSRKNV